MTDEESHLEDLSQACHSAIVAAERNCLLLAEHTGLIQKAEALRRAAARIRERHAAIHDELMARAVTRPPLPHEELRTAEERTDEYRRREERGRIYNAAREAAALECLALAAHASKWEAEAYMWAVEYIREHKILIGVDLTARRAARSRKAAP